MKNKRDNTNVRTTWQKHDDWVKIKKLAEELNMTRSGLFRFLVNQYNKNQQHTNKTKK